MKKNKKTRNGRNIHFVDSRRNKVNIPLNIPSVSRQVERKAKTIEILGLNEDRLSELSRKNLISLNVKEMKAVQAFFASQKRNPTDLEIEMIAQTWSEHCCHKTFKSHIDYFESCAGETKKEKIPSLFSLIRQSTGRISKKWCLSVFKDNAGIIDFDENNALAFKVETHNHPSALEPYGGAGTGVGGVIRDVLGAGLGAKPILNTDVFCFGSLDTSSENSPAGVLHPKCNACS